MLKMLKALIAPAAVAVFIVAVVMTVCAVVSCGPTTVPGDFESAVEVDDSGKIETAISNIVSDMRRRDFVPVNMEVKWHPAEKHFRVRVRGIDRGNLLKLNP